MGKSLGLAMEAVTWLPFAKLIWLVAADYDMTRQEFIYLSEAAVSCGLAMEKDVRLSMSKYSPSSMRSITGCIVETRTLADFRKLASKAPDLLIICEPGLIDNLQAVMELVWGRVSEKRGMVMLGGTSDKASEEWYELWSRWANPNPEGAKAFSVPTWQNTYTFPKGREDREFKVYEEMWGTESLMAHFGGVPAAPYNLVLRGTWSERVHVDENCIWLPSRPTEIAIDPNYSAPNAYTVECLQWDLATGDIFMVDEISESGLDHAAVIAMAKEREWFPHVFGGTIDPFAEGHHFGNAIPATYWLPLPLRFDHRPKVATSVQALKEALRIRPETGTPRMKVNPACTRFREEATRWRTDKYGHPSKLWCDAMKATAYWLNDKFFWEQMDSGAGPDDGDNVPQEWRFE